MTYQARASRGLRWTGLATGIAGLHRLRGGSGSWRWASSGRALARRAELRLPTRRRRQWGDAREADSIGSTTWPRWSRRSWSLYPRTTGSFHGALIFAGVNALATVLRYLPVIDEIPRVERQHAW